MNRLLGGHNSHKISQEFPGAGIPQLNVCTQSARYTAMVLTFLWKPCTWFLTRIKFFTHKVHKWITVLSGKNHS